MALKTEENNSDSSDEEMKLIFPKFKRFMKCEKQQEEKKNEVIPSFTLICFLCGKKRHIRKNYPKIRIRKSLRKLKRKKINLKLSRITKTSTP